MTRSARVLGMVALASASALVGCGGEDGDPPAVDAAWKPPTCISVGGEPVATFTRDGGTSHVPLLGQLPQETSDGGSEVVRHLIASPGAAGSMIAVRTTRDYQGGAVVGSSVDLVVSRDAGCTWTDYGPRFGSEVTQLVAGAGGTAYALQFTNQGPSTIQRIEADGGIEAHSAEDYGWAPAAIIAHPTRRDWLRTVTAGAVHETHDLRRRANAPRPLPAQERGRRIWKVDYDPLDWDRIAVIASRYDQSMNQVDEALITEDGGIAWREASLPPLGALNAIEMLSFARAERETVWAVVREDIVPLVTTERWLALSRDGGRSFERVLLLDGATGPVGELVPHPTLAHEAWWMSANRIVRYSAATGVVTVAPYPGPPLTSGSEYWVHQLRFHPTDPGVIYLGVGSWPVDF